MAYNTGNPVGSTDPRDLYDNASNLDEAVNTEADSWTDRLGKLRPTLKGAIDPTGLASAAASSAQRAAGEANRAEAARDAAQLSAGIFDDTGAGLGGTTVGDYFSTPSAENDEYLILYRHDSGPVATEIERYPSLSAVAEVSQRVLEIPGAPVVWGVADQDNWLGLLLNTLGELITAHASLKENEISTAGYTLQGGQDGGLTLMDAEGFIEATFQGGQIGTFGLTNSAYELKQTSVAGVLFADAEGFVGWQLEGNGDTAGPSGGDIQALSQAQAINTRNADNLAYSARLASSINPQLQRPVAQYNHFISYGQSLSTGYQGWPALTKTPPFPEGCLMLGDSPRPVSRNDSGFTPVGSAVLNSMKAVVQDMTDGSILTDAEVAALDPSAGNEGESHDVAALAMLRTLFLQSLSLDEDGSRQFVTTNCGVAGRTIEALSKGASPALYQRVIEAATLVKSIADSEGASYRVPAILWLQGEYNYTTDQGGAATKAAYKTNLTQLYSDLVADVCQGIADQSAPPAFVTYQTSGGYTDDTNDLAIGMAQLELAQEQRNWYLATPAYPFTDKGGHLHPNGYRWMGAQFAKVLHRVMTLGQDWQPLSPRRVTVAGNEVVIDFHVPAPPLQFGLPYNGTNAVDYPDKGFTVLDDGSAADIAKVEIVADTLVRITLAAEPAGTVAVRYADKTHHNGNGNLRDSDPTLAPQEYVYDPDSGQWEGTNIPELVGSPYPLHNWCVAFHLTAETN